MSREELFTADRHEADFYKSADLKQDDEIVVPVTRLGFEALLERAARLYDLPIDDKLRSILAGYVHHIPNDKNTLTVEALATALHKSVSNDLTWTIDQEIKDKAKKEFEAKQEALKNSNVTPINKDN